MAVKNGITVIALLALSIITTSCGSVQAAAPPPAPVETPSPQSSSPNSTIITQGTLLSSDQTGSFTVQNGSLYGPPASPRSAVKIHGNITVTGNDVLLEFLYVDGCILVDRANRVQLRHVWQQNCSGDGIIYQSDAITATGGNQACCGKMDDVFSGFNGGAGLKLVNTADVFISNSEFENNADCGARLVGSPTARIVNSDFGGNTICGLSADQFSAKLMLSNNQFGNNRGDDLVLQSQDNILNSLEFIGPAGACAIRSVGEQRFGTNFYGPRPLC